MKANVNDIMKQLEALTSQVAVLQSTTETPITMEFGEVPDDSVLIKSSDITGNDVADLVIKTVYAYQQNGYIKNTKVAYSQRASKVYVKASPCKTIVSHNPLSSGVNGYAVDFTTLNTETMTFEAVPCLGMEYDKQGFYSKLCL